MKVIDLLNKIAKGEIPKTIVYDERYFTYDKKRQNYFSYDDSEIDWKYTVMEYINDEVEIIEESQEHKIPEKLPYYSLEKIQKAKNKDEWREERISLLEKRIDDYHNKINEIIDYMEEIK